MNVLGRPALLLGVFAIVSCREPLQPTLASAVGTYVLQSVRGRGAATGSIVLSPIAQAARRVRYRLPDGSLSNEYVAVGTFILRKANGVEIALRDNNGASPYVWKTLATLKDGVLSLEYPDPADGPDIVETYRRP